jgi:hypothetical protein
MVMQQTPVPPGFEFGPPAWVGDVVMMAIAAVTVMWLGTVLIRALARRRGLSAEAQEELQHLRDRVAELEMNQGHLAELEERLDFAERLLARRDDAMRAPLPPGSLQ